MNDNFSTDPNGTSSTEAAQLAQDADVLQALAAANPVTAPLLDADGSPVSAQSPRGHTVLAAAMASTQSTTSGTAAPFGPPPVANAKGKRARLTDSTPTTKQRRWPLLTGVAAASVALLGGVLIFLPENTQPALAAVHEAASRTSDANTGRIVATFSAEGSDANDSGSIVGEITSIYDGEDFSIAIDLDEQSGIASDIVGDELPVSETRLVDGVIYADTGDGEWIGVEAPEFLGAEVSELIDPRNVLETVQELVEAEEIGTATINGVETTHFRSVSDIGDQSLTSSGWVAGLAAQEGIDGDGLVTIDLYVDAEGRLRQLDITGDLSEDTSDAAATFVIETQFLDLGADLSVEAPEGVEVNSLTDGFADLEFDLDD